MLKSLGVSIAARLVIDSKCCFDMFCSHKAVVRRFKILRCLPPLLYFRLPFWLNALQESLLKAVNKLLVGLELLIILTLNLLQLTNSRIFVLHR